MNYDIKRRRLFLFLLFSFGVLYYLIFPVMLSTYYIDDELLLSKYLSDLLFEFDYSLYYGYVTLFYILFIIGVYSYRGKVKFNNETNSVNKKDFFICFSLLFIFSILIFNYFLLKNELFKGYAGIDWNERNDQKSLISGFNVFLAVFSTYLWKCNSRQKWLSTIITFINSIMLLGLGGRMYVLVVLLCVLTYLVLYVRVSVKKIIIFSALSLFILLSIGIIRQGGEIDRKGLFFIFIAEPVFDWFSAGSLLKYNHLSLFEIPSILLSSIVSMVPTFFWSEKNEFITQMNASSMYYIESPVGGTNIIASVIPAFGIIGSLISIYLFGVLGGFLLKKSYKNSFCFMIFCTFCSLMPFMFFRDNMIIFQKNFLFNGIIIPYVIIKLNKLLNFTRSR